MKIRGEFDVQLNPQDAPGQVKNVNLGRMEIEKVYKGPFDGTGKGEMLSAVTDVNGSAGYVAIERVAGELNGRRGSFVVQHFGVMNQGERELLIRIIPDSGTEALTGITGTMHIDITDGTHYYEIDYELPA